MRALSVVVFGMAGLLVLAANGGKAVTPPPPTAPVRLAPTDERIERALQNRFACLGCHRIGDEGGAIGPTLNRLTERTDVDAVERMIVDPARTMPGTLMPRQDMPRLEARRLAEYLIARSQPGSDAPVQPEPPVALADGDRLSGPALYARHCASCHGPEGNGDGWNASTLPVQPTAHSDADAMSRRADDTLYDAIAVGAWVLDGSARMPGFQHMLDPAQIRALVAHIRTLCACEGPEWSRDGG